MSAQNQQNEANASPSLNEGTPAHPHSPLASISRLHREPSQQDLEIARQLQSFQSQGANNYPQDRDDVLSHGSREAQDLSATSEHAESVDGRYTQPPQHADSPSDMLQQRGPSAEPPPGGQVCTNCGTTKTPLWRRSPTGAVICNACGLYFKARNQMRPVRLKRTAAPVPSPQRPAGQPSERDTSPTSLQGGATYVSADQSTNGTCPGGGRCNGTGGHEGCNGCPAYNNRISKTAQVALRQSNDRSEPNGSTEPQNAAVPQTVVVACQNCGTTITPLWRRDEAGNAICNACGLYYKLHGQHRPVQMKKAEIKRRKRVVPANMNEGSVAYEASDIDPQMSNGPAMLHPPPIDIMEPRTGPGPIPVDFTDAFRSRQAPQHDHDHHVGSKRSYSASESDHYPHAQNMGFSAINAIDPSLPLREMPVNKEAKRAELQREADQMRQMLLAKERELAALGAEN